MFIEKIDLKRSPFKCLDIEGQDEKVVFHFVPKNNLKRYGLEILILLVQIVILIKVL